MEGNAQYNPPFSSDDGWSELFFDLIVPPIMGGGRSQTYQPGLTQAQHDPNSVQDIQADNFQSHGNPPIQGSQVGTPLGYLDVQSPQGVPAASPLPNGNHQLTPAFPDSAFPVYTYTSPDQIAVGPFPTNGGPQFGRAFPGETAHLQPDIHLGPNYHTGMFNPPPTLYPSISPQVGPTYQRIDDIVPPGPGLNNFNIQNPREVQLNDQGGPHEPAQTVQNNTIPIQEQLTKVYRILGEILSSNGPSFNLLLWTTLATELRATLPMVNEVIEHSPGSDQNVNVVDGQFRCLLCHPSRRGAFKNRGTFRRHVRDRHYPDCIYYCGVCSRTDRMKFRRKDKLHEHMRNSHSVQKLTKDQLATLTEHVAPPLLCALCPRSVGTWDQFFECLCRHCSISEADRNQDDSPDNDDSDGDDDSGDNGGQGGSSNGHGNGHQHFSSNGSGNSGNTGNGGQSHQFGGYLFANPGTGNGTGAFRHYDAADGKFISSEQVNSQKSAFENPGTRPNRSGISEPKTILTDTKRQKKSKLDDRLLWVDGHAHIPETFKTGLPFRLNRSNWEDQGDLGKQNAERQQISDKQAASVSVNDNIHQEFQRLRFFEGVLYENQKQGTFLTYFHETLVISAPGQPVALSMRDISYRRVELKSEKPPEIPGDHLFYLARGKDHSTSEANLEMARRASKRRAHLKVRIRAIAGVLALRAAVSKAPAAVENSEIGNEVGHEVGHEGSDGWELGIPLPPHASQKEVMKFLTWLIQMLVFFLRMHPSPKVSVMLVDDSFGVPRLT